MILEVQNGCFGYPKQPVILESINLSLEEGHILAILGPNGIGKTTLLKCMIGLLPWHSGKTLLYGKDIHTLKPKDVWSTISYIPQSRGFAFSYTGLEMVLLGRSAHLGAFQQPGKEEIEMAEAMMERAIRSLESNLPVPKNKRDVNSRPAMTNFSIFLLSYWIE